MPSKTSVPVFHPDHPHNRQPYPLYESRTPNQHLKRPTASSSKSRGMFAQQSQSGKYGEDGLSDSESSLSPSPSSKSRCFCGNPTQDGGIYCSVSCARSDAFSSLCYKPTECSTQPIQSHHQHPTISSAVSASLSRNASSASSTSIASSSSNQDVGDWNASHYRRLAQADLRRQERKEERRKRRAEGSLASSISTSRSTMMSVSSSSSRSVPDLIGGHSHSRNPSIASSITSMSSSNWGLGGSLSRNPSSASTSSRKGGAGYGGNVNIGAAIMEDEDEAEWLQSEFAQPQFPAIPTSTTKRPTHSRSGSKSASQSRKGRKHTPDPLPFGMGKDMRDVLEEIIQMEKSFLVSDNENDQDDMLDDDDDKMSQVGSTQPAGLFTSQFDRPPRTPSPVSTSKRRGSIAPGAPMRGHRSALSHSALPPPSPNIRDPKPQRPPSLIGLHQSSLSESHTALYLATASPVAPGPGRRSASPKLEYRKSITFTPDAAGPSISFDLPAPRRMFESPSGTITPMGRRRLNLTPQAVHPSMNGWRFPAGNGGSNMATPTRSSQPQFPPHSQPQIEVDSSIEPTLLWPSQPPNLQPALFPCSPAVETPEYQGMSRLAGQMDNRDSQLSAPGSGMRLGELLGSGNGDGSGPGDNGDVDMVVEVEGEEEEDDAESTEQGHSAMGARMMGYLPVFLEAEGFRAGDGTAGW
ncbi:uncharacterized protein I303_105494 [Kwoniella dejecticola CBS 10117]|uniref:Uncharacterized protein n=1 Tax=Kwoniella dejecticola CBS 10117 TaxID=1296121 RepID=A0A1A6A2C4_9TREE|nr:uncharacterized protein I303_05063 [Kwoniella dejecticola CBS 10117]OBR84206.1 hypothetical protein I303_05063 [Kwoniella dejecticola CBS 10117]